MTSRALLTAGAALVERRGPRLEKILQPRHLGVFLSVPVGTLEPMREFDLNIERALENWTVAHALREIIANALDEHSLTGSAEPTIYKDGNGPWHIRDRGRGLRYEHLTQNESKEKLAHPEQVVESLGSGARTR